MQLRTIQINDVTEVQCKVKNKLCQVADNCV